MDDAAPVRDRKGLGDLRPQRQRVSHGHGSAAQHGRQRFAFDVLHHDERAAVVGLAHLVHVADVRVIERRRCLGLAQQVPAGVVVIAAVRREELDGDVALERQVAGQIDIAHPAASEQADNAVVTQFRAWFGRSHREVPPPGMS